MVSSVILILGLLTQIVGTALAVMGLGKTWRQFAAPGASLSEATRRELMMLARNVWKAFARRLPRSLRHRGAIVDFQALAVVRTTASATTVRGYGAPPENPAAALPIVHERIGELRGEQDQLDAQFAKATRKMARIEERVSEERQALEERDREIAISGIPMALAGLLLLAVGVAAQLVAETGRLTGW